MKLMEILTHSSCEAEPMKTLLCLGIRDLYLFSIIV